MSRILEQSVDNLTSHFNTLTNDFPLLSAQDFRIPAEGDIQIMTDQTDQPSPESTPGTGGVSRRSVFRAAGVGAAVVGGGSLLEACSSSIKGAAGGSGST